MNTSSNHDQNVVPQYPSFPFCGGSFFGSISSIAVAAVLVSIIAILS